MATFENFLDDHFLEAYKRRRDLAGAREYLGRLQAATRLPAISRHGGPTGLGTSAVRLNPSHGSGARAPVFR
jgi:hypothetical protein